MSGLLRKIRHINEAAASLLEKLDFCTDSEIQSLTKEDLHELFPGAEKLRLRRTLFRIIHKQKPLNVLLRELKSCIPHHQLTATLSENGVVVDYLHILKDMRTQLNQMQSFLDAHIGLLEDISKAPVEQEPDGGALPETSSSAACTPANINSSQVDVHPRQAELMYQMVVSGQTLDVHLQLIAKIQTELQDHLQLISCSQGGQVIFIFCQTGSNPGDDIGATMIDVTAHAPVILVMMHHTHEVKHTLPMRTWSTHPNVTLQVIVFFHKEARGLLRCRENTAALSQIIKKLLELDIAEDMNDAARRTEGFLDDVKPLDHVVSELDFKIFGESGCSSSSSTSSSDDETKSVWECGD